MGRRGMKRPKRLHGSKRRLDNFLTALYNILPDEAPRQGDGKEQKPVEPSKPEGFNLLRRFKER